MGTFAAAAGITLPYLWRVETGRINLNLRSISRMAVALDVPMSAILEGIEVDPQIATSPLRRRHPQD